MKNNAVKLGPAVYHFCGLQRLSNLYTLYPEPKMSKKGNSEKQFQQAIDIGRNNSKVIPLIKQWCKHIVITDQSAGMIAAMGLPMQQRLSCPHTSGAQSAIDVETMAAHFIIEHCLSCPFHEEVSSDNFGRQVLEAYQKGLVEQDKLLEQKREKQLLLQKEVDALIENDPGNKDIPRLSALRLIQQLSMEEDRSATAEKILEAAKLSPQFFSSASIDYLSLFLEEKGGEIIAKAILAIKGQIDREISAFTLERVVNAIHHAPVFDEAVGIFSSFISKETIEGYRPELEIILDRCDYDNSYMQKGPQGASYPHTIRLFQWVADTALAMFTEMITTRLNQNRKVSRLNITGFLSELSELYPAIVLPFTDLVIRSFNFEDDTYGSSADYQTRRLLYTLYLADDDFVGEAVDRLNSLLSSDGQIEIIEFYGVLTDEESQVSEEKIQAVIECLIQLLIATKREDPRRRALLDVLTETTKHRPGMTGKHYDALTGFLVTLTDEMKTFRWQKAELEDENRAVSTFNSLQGKNVFDIDLIGSSLQREIRDTQTIVGNLMRADTIRLLPQTLQLIEGLGSKENGEIKANLIDTLREGIKDPLSMASLLPALYTFIYDVESEAVRDSGMKFMVVMIDEYPQTVTQTVIDTVKIFLNDPLVPVRVRALEAFREIMRHFPEQVDRGSINRVLFLLKDKYVAVHKTATRLIHSLLPFVNDQEYSALFYSLITLEDHYFKGKDFDFCEDLVRALLYITKERPKAYGGVVTTILVKYCNSGDYYTDKKFIGHLTEITEESDQFHDQWFAQAVPFLQKTMPDMYNRWSDERRRLFDHFYLEGYEMISRALEPISGFIKSRINKDVFTDVFDMLAVLCFYGFNDLVYELSQYLAAHVPTTVSNERVHQLNRAIHRMAVTERKALNKQIDEAWLKVLINEK